MTTVPLHFEENAYSLGRKASTFPSTSTSGRQTGRFFTSVLYEKTRQTADITKASGSQARSQAIAMHSLQTFQEIFFDVCALVKQACSFD